jgi:Icc-related predicted phosphoesterase
MRIVQISDTHSRHHLLTSIPEGDILVHCGDFSDNGTEDEVLDFLNWFIELPHSHKIFVTGNHDLCLWDADDIEDLPNNVHFLQDKGITINGVRFFGIAYNHQTGIIPDDTDVLVTHEPPLGIMDETMNMNWGNPAILQRVMQIKPKYHLFGHAHQASGVTVCKGIIFSNGSVLNDFGDYTYAPRVFEI